MRQESADISLTDAGWIARLLHSAEQPDRLDACRRDRARLRLEVPESRPAGTRQTDDGAALILAPCSSIHTFFMHFAIDVLFVKKDGRVAKYRLFPRGASPLHWARSRRSNRRRAQPRRLARAQGTSSYWRGDPDTAARHHCADRPAGRLVGPAQGTSGPSKTLRVAAGPINPAKYCQLIVIQDVSRSGHTKPSDGISIATLAGQPLPSLGRRRDREGL